MGNSMPEMPKDLEGTICIGGVCIYYNFADMFREKEIEQRQDIFLCKNGRVIMIKSGVY